MKLICIQVNHEIQLWSSFMKICIQVFHILTNHIINVYYLNATECWEMNEYRVFPGELELYLKPLTN